MILLIYRWECERDVLIIVLEEEQKIANEKFITAQILSEKLDNLLDGINDSYGKMLLEELIGRLETTIKDFNDEIVELCSQLSEKEKERQRNPRFRCSHCSITTLLGHKKT